MADETTTTSTSTSEDKSTTTTSTEATTTSTTVDAANAHQNTAEKQGEVQVDKGARADVLGGANSGPEDDAKAQEKNIEGSKADALANHAAEHANDGTDEHA